MMTIFTDGGVDHNNRKNINNIGGYAYIILNDSGIKIHEYFNKTRQTTNNRMELSAVIAALSYIKNSDEEIIIYSDSTYVVSPFELKWINKWKDNNFLKKNSVEEMPNASLWKELCELLQNFPNVNFKWIKAHQNQNTWNDYVDKLVQSVYQKNFTVIN